jgi:multidrug resistance efflux pump
MMSSAVVNTFRRLRRFLIPMAILAVALVIFFYMSKTKPESKPIEAAEKSWTVNTEQVQPAAWSAMLTLYGKVESLWSSKLTAAINADVIEVLVREGDRVNKGDLLVELDQQDAHLALQQSTADVALARAKIAARKVRHETDLATLPRERKLLQLSADEVARLQGLTKKKVSSQSALDTARQAVERQAINVAKLRQSIDEQVPVMAELESGLARAMALQQKAELELARASIRAPFNARVAQVFASPGNRVRSGDALVEVFDTDALVFRALIPQRYLAVIHRAREDGHELEVSGMLDEQPLRGKLLTLGAQVSQGNGGVEALFEIQGDAAVLQQGRLLQLRLTLPQQAGLIALPHEALYGSNQVYQIDDESRLRLLQVERVGETTTDNGEGRVLIRAPQLEPGSRVLSTQLPSAMNGLLVKLSGQAK